MYMDAFRLTHSSRDLQNSRIFSCVRFFRHHPVYARSSLVFIPENAPGSRGGEIAHVLFSESACMTMEEFGKEDKRPGVPKRHEDTQSMVKKMKRLLTNDSIYFSADLGTYPGDEVYHSRDQITPGYWKHCVKPDLVNPLVDQLCAELLAFKFLQNSVSGRGKYTGKEGTSGRDDLGVAALMGPRWAKRFHNSSEYTEFRRKAYQRIQFAQ